MLKNITLGQYFPGDTFIHRLDPRSKILITIAFIVALFLAHGLVSYAVCAAFLALCVVISKIKAKALFSGLRPILIIVLITALLNLFYTPGEALVSFWIFKISKEGIFAAVFMMLRIVMLICGTFLLTYTTAPMQLTDAIESLLSPLKKIRFPVHELAMMMSIALRFIPTLIEETDKIMSAQKARGADFETGGLISRAKAMLPLLIPLFISAFRRADELATAMESRCYSGGEGRTRMKQLRFLGRDAAAGVVTALFIACVCVLRHFGI